MVGKVIVIGGIVVLLGVGGMAVYRFLQTPPSVDRKRGGLNAATSPPHMAPFDAQAAATTIASVGSVLGNFFGMIGHGQNGSDPYSAGDAVNTVPPSASGWLASTEDGNILGVGELQGPDLLGLGSVPDTPPVVGFGNMSLQTPDWLEQYNSGDIIGLGRMTLDDGG